MRARGGYLGLELGGHLGSVVLRFQKMVGNQLDAILPTSNGFEVSGELPTVLPLLVLGEDFDEEQPGGPLRGSTRFTVSLVGISISQRECHGQLKIALELVRFMKANFSDTGELIRNRYLKLGYLHKALEDRERLRTCEILNKLISPGLTLSFGMEELRLMTENLKGKPRPSYELVPVGRSYVVWMTELERARSIQGHSEYQYTAEEILLQDKEKQQARDLRAAAHDETGEFHTALEEDFFKIDVAPRVTSELGALFQTEPGVNLGEMGVAPREFRDLEGGDRFSPGRYSTPGFFRSSGGQRRVDFQGINQKDKREALILATQLREGSVGRTPMKKGGGMTARRLEGVLTGKKMDEIWTREREERRTEGAASMEQLWGSRSGQEGTEPLSLEVRQAAHQLFDAWTDGIQDSAGLLEQKLSAEETGLGPGEVKALITALIKTGTSGEVKTAFVEELIKGLGGENNTPEAPEEKEQEKTEEIPEIKLGEEATKAPEPAEQPPALPSLLKPLPPNADQGLGSGYESLASIPGPGVRRGGLPGSGTRRKN